MTRRPPHRHRRRQPLRARRRDAGRQPVPAPARSAGEPARATGTTIRRCPTCSPGMFIGPTSQAPRVDEARNDQLYELEIASASAASSDSRQATAARMPPWLVDRTLRNILIDVTGNTHRGEFCIDKLYSPDGPTGRLGLLELRALRDAAARAHEPRAAAAAARAGRALLAAALHARALTRWGTELHDRFLLPHLRARWISTTCSAELQRRRLRVRRRVVRAALRVPLPAGRRVAARGIELTLRNALEPWHVMGEEGAAGGTVRYVDSSLERIEVHVTGLNDNRHVRDRQRRAAAAAADRPRRRVRRRRALQGLGSRRRRCIRRSASHAPLTFDLVDTWMQPLAGRLPVPRRASGRAQLRDLPGQRLRGREPPARALLRRGHTPGPHGRSGPPQRSLEFPFTLDLRRRR